MKKENETSIPNIFVCLLIATVYSDDDDNVPNVTKTLKALRKINEEKREKKMCTHMRKGKFNHMFL